MWRSADHTPTMAGEGLLLAKGACPRYGIQRVPPLVSHATVAGGRLGSDALYVVRHDPLRALSETRAALAVEIQGRSSSWQPHMG